MSKWHFSTDPRENYKGLDVPSGHGGLFRAMDGQERFYAEIMRKQQEKDQLSLKNTLNQAAQKAMTELNHIKNNHLTVFNSKVQDEISTKTLDPFIVELLKKNPIVDLSHYTLNVLKHIRENYKLKDSINTENIIKDNLGYLLTDYREIYNNISDPFNSVISDLFKAGSQIEIDFIKNTFLQNSNHLNTYFEYSEDNNNQSLISEIVCKESILKVVEDIGLKLENLNKAKSEQNDQEYLLKIESSNEKEPHEDISVNNSFHFSQNPSVKSEPILSQFKIVPMSELEKALARIKELEDQNNKKEDVFKNLERIIASKDKDLDYAHNMILDRDKIIDVQSHTINGLTEDKVELRLEKNEWKTKYETKDNSLQKMIEELTIEKAKVSEFTQKFDLHNSDNRSFNSWEKLDKNNDVPIIGKDNLEDQI